MLYQEISLPIVTEGKAAYTASLFAYVPKNNLPLAFNQNRPAVVIFPGGGYSMTYDGEAEPIALRFAAEGIAAFVLRYSCKPAVFPQALCEALWSVGYVRSHAEEFGINPNNIATLGFSAGGHLCACTGTLWKQDFLRAVLPGEARLYRPDKLILCYPVITSSQYKHGGSFDNLLGARKDDEALRRALSVELQVEKDTPPAFIWHTFEDGGVPVQNSLLFASALAEKQVLVEMHIYPHGGHGLCSGDHVTREEAPIGSPLTVHEWMKEAVRFSLDTSI